MAAKISRIKAARLLVTCPCAFLFDPQPV